MITFRPSLSTLLAEAWYRAKGLRFPYPYWHIAVCYICGRQEDFVFNFVELVPYFDMSLPYKARLVHVCTDHGRITNYNCITGEAVTLPLPKPYWMRKLRDAYQQLALKAAIAARFAWFASYTVFFWYVIAELRHKE